MKFVLLTLLTSWVATLVKGVPVDAARDQSQCPSVPCPNRPPGYPCEKFVPTYYTYEGKRCQGCDQCISDMVNASSVQERALIPPIRCPLIACARLDDVVCPISLVPHNYTLANRLCYGCHLCPLTLASLQPVSGTGLPITVCPILECLQVTDVMCPVALTSTTYTIGGRICHGCPRCGVTSLPVDSREKRQVVGPVKAAKICPVVDCAYTAPCPVTMVQGTIDWFGQTCPGCPLCPVASGVTGASDIS